MPIKTLLSRGIAVLKGPVARGSIVGLVLRLCGLALMFGQSVLAARLLGASEYGVVTLLLAIAQIAAVIAALGYGPFAIAQIPRTAKLGQSGVPALLLKHACKRIAALSLVLMPIAFVIAVLLLGELPWRIALPFLASIPILAAIQLFRGVSLGLGRPFWGIAPGEVIRPALLVAALIVTALFAKGSSALFITLYMISAALALAFALPHVRQGKDDTTASTTCAKAPPIDQSAWDRAALPFLGIHLASILQLELATVMLGLFASPEAVGLFQPISRISMLLMLPLVALSIGFNPKIAALYGEGKIGDIASLARKHTLAATLSIGVSGVIIGGFAPFILAIFGPEFVAGAPLVWVLVFGRIAQAACGPGGELLSMTQRSHQAVWCMGLSLLTEALLGVILIPIYGLMGAAIAVAAGLLMRGCLLAMVANRALGIDPSLIGKGAARPA